jgi:hypothetical protein
MCVLLGLEHAVQSRRPVLKRIKSVINNGSWLPRVDHLDAATLKIQRIARRHAGTMRTGDGGNLGVELTDGSACVTALFGNQGIGQS